MNLFLGNLASTTQKQLEELKKQNNALREPIGDQDSTKQKLEEEILNLKSEKDILKKTIQELQQINATVKDECDVQQEKLKELQIALYANCIEVGNKEEKIQKLISDNDSLQDKMLRLKTALKIDQTLGNADYDGIRDMPPFSMVSRKRRGDDNAMALQAKKTSETTYDQFNLSNVAAKKIKSNSQNFDGVPNFSISCSDLQVLEITKNNIKKLGGNICGNLTGFDRNCTHLVCEKPNQGGSWKMGAIAYFSKRAYIFIESV